MVARTKSINLKRISEIGVPVTMAPEEARYIRQSNMWAFYMLVSYVPWFVGSLSSKDYLTFAVNLAAWFTVIGVLALNSRGRHRAARLLFLFTVNINFLIINIFAPDGYLGHYFFFISAAAAALFFPKKENLAMILMILFSVLCYHLALAGRGYFGGETQFNPRSLYINNKFFEYMLYIAIVLIVLVSRAGTIYAEERLKAEQARSEMLLLNILPKPIADRLKDNAGIIADGFNEVTVMFSDVVGFTRMSGNLTPGEVVAILNEIFSAFDRLASKYGLEKIKTIGDGYMVVGGAPVERPDHAEAVLKMAIEMLRYLAEYNKTAAQPLGIRIGLNSGPIVAGVIGKTKFAYDLWGDTVNTASRMESHGQNGMIHVSASTYEILKNRFEFEKRGEIEVKGKGLMETYFLKNTENIIL